MTEIAIIGMACRFPGAPDLQTFSRNLVRGVDAIGDVPAGRWNADVFYDPESGADDRVYTKRGGYLGATLPFDPVAFGIMPAATTGGEIEQYVVLEVAQAAMADAGYANRPFERARTQFVIGRGNYGTRAVISLYNHTLGVQGFLETLNALELGYSREDLEAIKDAVKANLPRLGADVAASLVPNLATGRTANRLDLMGPNFTVDAACASGLIALDVAAWDLATGRCDLALAGAVHLGTSVPFLSVFCQLGALARSGTIRPFDEKADGTLAGEGIGVVVLKRRADAERDGDRIYAVIRGIGTSSDGRAQGPLTPRVDGEELALRRAYDAARVPPASVGLIEAHGTGMPVGDVTEIEALRRVFGGRSGPLRTCAIGSVKSMIGHLMPAAGIAGLIKAALALYHKVLPPSLHCDTPNPAFDLAASPCYVNTVARPWVHGHPDTPRRAGVSAFGFGGINAHVVLEEVPADPAPRAWPMDWPVEVCILQAGSVGKLVERAARLDRALGVDLPPALRDVAATLSRSLRPEATTLALVASSVGDLRDKLQQARTFLLEPGRRRIKDDRGIYFTDAPLGRQGRLAFLFPGEAAQYPGMLAELCLYVPEIRAAFDALDRRALAEGRTLLPSQYQFPLPTGTAEERELAAHGLRRMAGGLELVLTANYLLSRLLRVLGVIPAAVLGHSCGEYSALVDAGVLPADARLGEAFAGLGARLERRVTEVGQTGLALLAAGTDRRTAEEAVGVIGSGLEVAMDNCRHQVILAGPAEAVERAGGWFRGRGVICQEVPFEIAYHTAAFGDVVNDPIDAVFGAMELAPPACEVYSCTTARPYPGDAAATRRIVGQLSSRPVEFAAAVEALYADGVRAFVESGPKGNLTAFTADVLRGRPHLALAADVPRRGGLVQLQHVLATLAAHGVSLDLAPLYRHRASDSVDLEEGGSRPVRRSPSTVDLPLESPGINIHALRSILPERVRSPHARLKATGPPGVAPASPEGPASARAAAMEGYLRTMQRFLAVQQQVMEAFLASGRRRPAGPLPPFVDTVTAFEPGRTVTVRRRLDPDDDPFLRDHAMIERVSDADPSLRPRLTTPLTVLVEMMTEAAALLFPEQIVIAARDIHGLRWLEATNAVDVTASARRIPERAEATVEIRLSDEPPDTGPLARATVVFASVYPSSPPAGRLALVEPGPSAHSASEMYARKRMFHGPRWQAVAAIEALGANGIVGELDRPAAGPLFRDRAESGLLTAPVEIDAAGQLLGYWVVERLPSCDAVAPVHVEALEFYGPPKPGRLWCDVEVLEVGEATVRATLRLFTADGRLYARLVDWRVRRFRLPARVAAFLRAPDTMALSEPWDLPVGDAAGPDGDRLTCQRLTVGPLRMSSGFGREVALLVLSRAERSELEAANWPEARRAEWLLGRIVVKDAVRRHLARRHGAGAIRPADVEVYRDARGAPVARLLGSPAGLEPPAVALSHAGGVVVALAVDACGGARPGIDIEPLTPRPEGFEELALAPVEARLLEAVPPASRDEWITRLWCAKEAAGKSLRTGLPDGPRALVAHALDPVQGRIDVALPEGDRLVVRTVRDGDLVIAVTLGARSGT